MFAALHAEIQERISTIQTFLREVAKLVAEPFTASPAASTAVTVAKGLAFVELYGTYEQTILRSVQASLLEIRKNGVSLRAIRLELLGMILDPEIRAAMDCGVERVWETRMQLFRKVHSNDAFGLADTFFPHDGSHFRERQLRTIWELFGIATAIVPAPPLLGRIKELVDNRNAIAHGRRTAHDVGRYYSISDIEVRISDTQDLCSHVAATMETHCSNMLNLQR